EQRTPLDTHLECLLAHDAGHSGDLIGCLALEPECGDKGAELGLAGLALHDLAHGRGGLVLGEAPALLDEGDDRVSNHAVTSSAMRERRKLRSRSWPTFVMIDSGWNCT